jgi:Domain of unknown function (DUF1996)
VSRLRAVVCISVLSGIASISVAGLSFAAGPSGRDMRTLAGVNFISTCGFSHRAPDDPIVFPQQPGRSHDHTFVGNTTTSASSTLESLLQGSSTCQRAGDTAAYWMPTLVVGAQSVEPRGATIYYRRRTLDPVRAFPPGLRMIAGDARATSAQPGRVTFWNCGVLSGIPRSAAIPTCPNERRASLRLHVTFPNCWNGAALDSADHQSHMAYSRRGRCPVSHPVAVPAISLVFRYASTGGPDAALASGGQFSAHADFFNAWNQEALDALVQRCLNALRHCARGA